MARSKRGTVNAKYTYSKPTQSGRSTIGDVGIRPHCTDAKYTHALVNPFGVDARGAKIPDDSSTRSVAYTLKWAFDQDTDTEGDAAFNLQPILSTLYNRGTNVTNAGIINSWGDQGTSPDVATIQASFTEYRIVSWGVRIIPLLAPTEQSGYFRLITASASPLGDPLDTTGGLFEEVQDYPVASADIHWVSKPVGNEYKEYVSTTGGVANWENLTVYTSGMPNSRSRAFRVEVTMNLELQADMRSIGGSLSTPAADHRPRAIMAADHARNRMKNAHHGSTESVTAKLWGLAKQGIVAAAETFGPPLLGRLLGSFQRRPPPMVKDVIEVD